MLGRSGNSEEERHVVAIACYVAAQLAVSPYNTRFTHSLIECEGPLIGQWQLIMVTDLKAVIISTMQFYWCIESVLGNITHDTFCMHV